MKAGAAPRIIMLGTDPAGRGGVAAVVAGWRAQGLFEREGVRYVITHAERGPLGKLAALGGAAARLLYACVAARPAIVHAHSASRASFWRKSLLLALARAAGCRTVYHLHGGGFREFAGQEAGPLARWWIRRTLRRSSAVIALSDSWAEYLRTLAPGANVLALPNAVPLPPEPGVGAGLAEPGRILMLGRASAAKGMAELLAALARLAPRHPALRLVVGGDGDLDYWRGQAAALGVADRLELLGWIDPARCQAELARAALFCLPSHVEGLPMALLEAMAAARPVVATAVGAMPEVLRHGHNGLLVAPQDAAALAQALEALLDDPARAAALGAAARATIAARYSAPVVLEQLSALYRRLAQ
jgi:glycosyltransferase involved in cell wall biosynthesis